MMNKSIYKKFMKYVSLNVLGMIGLSCYILADTFFVAKGLGPTGIAALNFSIPIYSVIHGSGLMIAMGGATRYSIVKSQGDNRSANKLFTHSIEAGFILSIAFILIGIIMSKPLAGLLGAGSTTLSMTNIYLKTILCFSPFFITNNILLAFVRNDNNPNLAMTAMVAGSLSNVLLDYIFMFPLRMGMFGAAFATGLAPIISMGILSIHFIRRTGKLHLRKCRITLSSIGHILTLGLSSFINEVSSAVVLITFNLIILGLEGDMGVASYGIVANIALVGIAVFTGVAQGIQPLVSRAYGMGEHGTIKKLLQLATGTSVTVAIVLYFVIFTFTEGIVGIFNSEQNKQIAELARIGLRIYFMGFLFAGINIIIATYFSAAENPKSAFLVSITRGVAIIIPFVLIFAKLWAMTGVWLAYVLTEAVVTGIAIYCLAKSSLRHRKGI